MQQAVVDYLPKAPFLMAPSTQTDEQLLKKPMWDSTQLSLRKFLVKHRPKSDLRFLKPPPRKRKKKRAIEGRRFRH